MKPWQTDMPVTTLSIDGPLFAAEPVMPAGPFDLSPAPAERTAEDVMVAEMIWRHQGRANAVSLAEVSEVTGIEPRVVKQIVQRLRTAHLCRIGSGHHDPAGYYWIVTDEDRILAVSPLRSQILAMWETLRAIDTRSENLGLLVKMRERV